MPSPESRPRRFPVLVPLASLLVSAALVVGSGAEFTSQTANAGNLAASGTLTQANSKNSAAIFVGQNLRPGDETAGEVTITNTGSLAGVFTLTEKDVTNTFSAGVLSLKITDTTTGTVVYSGAFGAAGSISLGSFAAGAARTYHFSVVLSAGAGNIDQAKTASAVYQWDAVPTR